VVDEIRELQRITLVLQQATHGLELPGNRRMRMALGCLDLVIEYQAGVAILADQPLWGPVFALQRVLFETFIRGSWLARCATENQLNWFEAGTLSEKKRFHELVTEVEVSLGAARPVFTKLRQSSWGMFNDFTHAGFEHIVRRNGEATTGPNYAESELIQVIKLTRSLGLLAAIELADLSGHTDIGRALMAEARQIAALPASGHQRIDARSLAMHQLIASKLLVNPGLIDQARITLTRWRAQAAEPAASYFLEWEKILEGSPEVVADFLGSSSEEATRLRQSSPFTDVLTSEERSKIFDDFR
jgi:hypothetical protein